jgi:hypothetical protein
VFTARRAGVAADFLNGGQSFPDTLSLKRARSSRKAEDPIAAPLDRADFGVEGLDSKGK